MKKNILVTGGSGFIGSALLKFLKRKKQFNILEYSTAKHGSISDSNSLKAFSDLDIHHVFHLGSKTFVPDSWKKPTDFFQVNVMGTQQVLDFCNSKKCSLTYVSAYLYGDPLSLPIKETTALQPNNPYALSKHLAEELCQFYAKNFDLNICILRPFNVFGKDQADHWLIPYIIKQLKDSTKENIQLRGLSPKRDYVYIDDVIAALWLSMDYAQLNTSVYNTFNIALGKSLSVREVFTIIRDVMGSNKGVISEDVVRKNEIMDTQADISSAQTYLKWSPTYSFEEGIRQILGVVQTV